MGNIHYDPEQILNGFTEDSLKDLAKRLKRRIRAIKSDIIQDILSPPKESSEDRVKVWQEINWILRKQLEGFSKEDHKIFFLEGTPLEEQFKVGYMFTLSSNPELKAMGEELYCQAEENRVIEKAEKYKGDEKDEDAEDDEEEAIPVLAVITAEVEPREVKVPFKTGEVIEQIEAREIIEPIAKMPSRGQRTDETKELQKRIRILEKKLKTTNSEGLRTKGRLEKLKSDLVALRAQWLREKEETGKYRNRVRELEVERMEKDKEIEILKKKLEQSQYNELPKVSVDHDGEIDLAAYQGRKALIFAERDQDVDIRLNALGIIPIWAMEIDWNRPRRRMSTCQIVLYKRNNEKLKKLEEIRGIARYLNIPCNELLDV